MKLPKHQAKRLIAMIEDIHANINHTTVTATTGTGVPGSFHEAIGDLENGRLVPMDRIMEDVRGIPEMPTPPYEARMLAAARKLVYPIGSEAIGFCLLTCKFQRESAQVEMVFATPLDPTAAGIQLQVPSSATLDHTGSTLKVTIAANDLEPLMLDMEEAQ